MASGLEALVVAVAVATPIVVNHKPHHRRHLEVRLVIVTIIPPAPQTVSAQIPVVITITTTTMAILWATATTMVQMTTRITIAVNIIRLRPLRITIEDT